MTGNVALDVVIGLVFIYLLYSLYATVLMEIVASFFGLRARNLRYAIKRMLMDEKTHSNSLVRLGIRILNSFLSIMGRSGNLTNDTLYQSFFKQPSIKYLGSGGVNSSPSYLSAENFSKSIMDAIKTNDPDVSVLASIEEGLMKLPEDSETRIHIQSLLDDANNDLAKFRILLEQWFNDTMDRATGWYKRSTQMILMMVGFALVISFNVDTLAIIKKLANDTNARDQLVKMAIDFTEKNSSSIAAIKEKSKDTVNITQSVQELNKRLDSLQLLKKSLSEDIQNSQNLLSSQWNLSSVLHYDTSASQPVHKDSIHVTHRFKNGDIVYVIVHKSIDPTILKSVLPRKAKPDSSFSLTIRPFIYQLYYVLSFDHVWGYLLTVLALSLGAPFWFDLLNKLIRLRSSKSVTTEPELKSGAANSSPVNNRATLNRAG